METRFPWKPGFHGFQNKERATRLYILMKFKGLHIRAKLILAFTFVAWFMGVVGYLSVDFSARQINRSFYEMVNVITPKLQALFELKSAVNEFEGKIVRFALMERGVQEDAGASDAEFARDVNASVEKMNKWTNQFIRFINAETGKEALFGNAIRKAKQEITALISDLLRLQSEGASGEAQSAKREELALAQEDIKRFIAQATDFELAQLEEQNIAVADAIAATVRSNIFIVGGSALIALIIGAVLANVFSRGIIRVRNAARAVATGNLDTRVAIGSHDEIGELAHSFNEMAATLQETYGRLERDRDRLDAIIANLETGIIEYTHDFRVMLINQKAEEMLGVKKEEVTGMIITSDTATRRPELISLVQALYPILSSQVKKIHIKEGAPDILEMKLEKPAALEVQMVTIPLRDEKKVIVRYLKVIRDVSRENAIAHSKSEFISVAAHQLRTPLSAIKWVFRLMLDEDAGPVNKEQKELLKKGYDSNERMIELVTDMLDVARIEEGRFGFEFHYANIADLIQKSIDAFAVKAKEKSISFLFEKQGGLPSVKIDSARIELVLQNLIDNALKYTPIGGKITITASVISGFVRISVSDTGIGVPKDEVPKLFSKFFRGTNAVKFETEGSGLGLFIIKNIVERHGGTIFAETEEGKGSVFYLTLPLDARMIPDAEKKTEEFVQGLSTTEEKPQKDASVAFEQFVEGM